MEKIRIFIASSTEGKSIAAELCSALQAELGIDALVELWTEKFEFMETAIESLETVANETDFAMVVMTPDDVTVSREKEERAPRDNLVFELGLFIGALGRNRSIVAREAKVAREARQALKLPFIGALFRKFSIGARDAKQALKLPSDMLGVTVLTYNSASQCELRTSLHEQCEKLATHIRDRGVRPKWLAHGQASRAANEQFCHQIEGAWWERVFYQEGTALSFFTITTDPVMGNLVLEGTSFGADGKRCAKWDSEMTRLYPNDRRIVYLWHGNHTQAGVANLDFHGYGTLKFKLPGDSSSPLMRGTCEFWDVDEAVPGKTVYKQAEIRRILNEEHKRKMRSGSSIKKHDLVQQILEDW
jgi:predicted nucleotide-binding protein